MGFRRDSVIAPGAPGITSGDTAELHMGQFSLVAWSRQGVNALS